MQRECSLVSFSWHTGSTFQTNANDERRKSKLFCEINLFLGLCFNTFNHCACPVFIDLHAASFELHATAGHDLFEVETLPPCAYSYWAIDRMIARHCGSTTGGHETNGHCDTSSRENIEGAWTGGCQDSREYTAEGLKSRGRCDNSPLRQLGAATRGIYPIWAQRQKARIVQNLESKT